MTASVDCSGRNRPAHHTITTNDYSVRYLGLCPVMIGASIETLLFVYLV
jgi:hypothetical protein